MIELKEQATTLTSLPLWIISPFLTVLREKELKKMCVFDIYVTEMLLFLFIFLVETNCNAQIFRNKLTFFAAAKVSSSFPPPDVPEIAFAGTHLKFCTCLALSQILDTLTSSTC